ncbi:MAG: glycosyl transferase [Epulopiscium sp.]|nr:glycosyl transferase [Candidatus Epulonipiscium sp.]
MIPRIIHYCWFGKGELSPLAKKCIASWKKHMPDCEIKEWNEDNFDVNMIQYTKDAYKNKKYAFVSDFARFYILRNYGGIYMDVDVELIKPLDDLLDNKIVLGFERIGKVNPGLICASEPNVVFLDDMISIYNNLNFFNSNGSLNLNTIVDYTTTYLISKGLVNKNKKQTVCDVTIYPIDYFCPINMLTNELVITENTYSIHHFAASWLSPWGKFKKKIRKIIGAKIYNKLHELKMLLKTY